MDREMWKVPSLKENTFVFFYERLHVLSRHTTGSFHFPLLRWHASPISPLLEVFNPSYSECGLWDTQKSGFVSWLQLLKRNS